ncbi:hypothetical protein Q8F55_005412 [Vanrija albida]|uniref:Uncharacterized protein n=1 Tax=Vanrija albida TaxID=181172 RepID=A0ABR3Q1K9_9TREE
MVFRDKAAHAEALKRANTDPLKPGHHTELYIRTGSIPGQTVERKERAEQLKQAGIAGDYNIRRINFWYGEIAFFNVRGGLSWAMRKDKDEALAASIPAEQPLPTA